MMQLYDVLNKFDIKELGKVESYQNLALVRLFGEDRFSDKFLTLDEVIGDDRFVAREKGEVNHITLQNGLERKVFIASGMTLEGGTQNRAAVYPFIIPPRSGIIDIPVHCIEHHQGLVGGKAFRRSSTILMASARTTETTGSRIRGTSQTRTWEGIRNATLTFGAERGNATEDYVTTMGVASAPGTGLPEYLAAIGEARRDQLGYIAAVRSNGQIFFYADLFGQADIYQRLHQKLVQSVATVAKQVFQGDITIKKDDFYHFLNQARTAELKKQEVDLQLLGQIYTADKPVSGVALMLEDIPIQLSLRKDEYESRLDLKSPLGAPTHSFQRTA